MELLWIGTVLGWLGAAGWLVRRARPGRRPPRRVFVEVRIRGGLWRDEDAPPAMPCPELSDGPDEE